MQPVPALFNSLRSIYSLMARITVHLRAKCRIDRHLQSRCVQLMESPFWWPWTLPDEGQVAAAETHLSGERKALLVEKMSLIMGKGAHCNISTTISRLTIAIQDLAYGANPGYREKEALSEQSVFQTPKKIFSIVFCNSNASFLDIYVLLKD